MKRRLGGAVVAICGFFASGPIEALELVPAEPSVCVERVAGGPSGGIATGDLVTDPIVRLCDGTWRGLALRDGRLEFTTLDDDPPAEDRAASGAEPLILPVSEITHGPNRIAEAWLIGPTEIYGHGILGDGTEASELHLRLAGGGRRDHFLGAGSVFEDPRVRLVDLTGAGEVEIALIETPHIGGTLKLFALHDQGLVLEASAQGFSNHAIGSRILNLSAVLDWDGDGGAELLYGLRGSGLILLRP